MDRADDYFLQQLTAYFAARGRTLSDRTVRVLRNPPDSFDEDDWDAYWNLVKPAREFVKCALREMLEADEGRRAEWFARLPTTPRSVLEGFVAEVLRGAGSEKDVMPDVEGTTPDTGQENCRTGEGEIALQGERDLMVERSPNGAIEVGSGKGASKVAESRKGRAIARAALRVLEWSTIIVLAIFILLAAFLMVAPRFGMSAHPVLSGSMEPALKVGGMIICRDVHVSDVKVGDIIGFNAPDGRKVTHRVIDIVEEDGKRWFQTKGDANEDPDPDLVSISSEKVDKVVFHIPYLGFFSSFMQSKLAFLVFICAPALILMVLFGKDLVKAVGELKREKAGLRD